MVKLLGLSGSPRKGATEYVIQKALESLAEKEGIQTNFMTLRGKNIQPCNGCGHCIQNKTECVIQDDAQPLINQFITYDAYLIGSPVYVHTVTPQMMAFFTRMRPLRNHMPGQLRYKMGAAVAVGGARNGGEEFAVNTLLHLMMTRGINIVSNEFGGYIGGKVWSRDNKNFTAEIDEVGMTTVTQLANKLADISLIFKAGQPPQ